MIRLLATDFDETITEETGVPLPAVVAALQDFVGRGGAVLVASGRVLLSLERAVAGWHIPCHLAATNGAVLESWPERELLLSLHLAEEVVARALAVGEGRGKAHLLLDDRLYARESKVSRRYSELLKVPFYTTPDIARHIGPTVRAVSWRCEPDETPRLRADLGAALDGVASVTASHTLLVDVNPAGAGKGAALRLVQKRLGIGPEETLSVGDAPNDLSLLMAAGQRAAVANAATELSAVATYVASASRGWGAIECFRHFGLL